MTKFIPLHVHSQFSILNSTCSIDNLVQLAVDNKMDALALTDSANLFGAIDFYQTCKASKIKPIMGCQLFVSVGSRFEKKKTHHRPGYKIVLLAKDFEGYKNICRLSSLGYLEGFYHYPRIDFEILKKHSSNTICLMGGSDSLVGALIADFKNEKRS